MANSDASQCQFLETGVWVWTHRRYIADNIQAVWRGSQDSQEFVKAFCIVPGCLKLQLFRKTCHQFLARSVDSIIVSKTYKPNSGNNKNQTKSNANRPTGLSYSSFHPFLPLRSGRIESPHAVRQPGNKKLSRIFCQICLQSQQPTMIQRQASKNTEVRYCKTPTAPWVISGLIKIGTKWDKILKIWVIFPDLPSDFEDSVALIDVYSSML